MPGPLFNPGRFWYHTGPAMRRTILPLLLLLLSPAAPSAEDFTVLPVPKPESAPERRREKPKKRKFLFGGRYKLTLMGILCNACTRAVVEDLRELEGVRAASFDFEEGLLDLTITHGAKVRIRRIERTLSRASRRVDLGTQFRIGEIRRIK